LSDKQTDHQDHKDHKARAGKKNEGQFKAGMAVGVGSAAIVAALLYARSHKARKK
jgi:hypothetical protein